MVKTEDVTYLRRKFLRLSSLMERRLRGIYRDGFADYITQADINRMPSILVECGIVYDSIMRYNKSSILEYLKHKDQHLYWYDWSKDENGKIRLSEKRYARGFGEWCMLFGRNDI